MSAVTWNILSLRDIARQMTLRGFPCSKDVIGRLMHEAGYSLQGMAKVLEGRQHEDRDIQFGNINAEIARAVEDGEPVISVDGKKKEQLGPRGRAGRAWRPRGDRVKVLSHDFPDPAGITICPYGIYDVAANRGFVSVGTSGDTAAFAAGAIRRWWQGEGSLRYPRAGRLPVICDAGGANDCRSHLWKDQLARLAEETGLRVEVMHFPPGTSKWNKIEHRLFCHITRTWRARPLMTVAGAVAGIAATVTSGGLKCTAVTDPSGYPTGLKVPPARVRELEGRHLDRSTFHGEWNYALLPAPRPAPEPPPAPGQPGPDPAALAAAAGVAGFTALLAEISLPWQAGREHRLTLARGRARVKDSGGGPARLPFEAAVAAAACRLRLGMSYTLLGQLFGVWHTTIRDAVLPVIPLLEARGITPGAGSPRIKTLTQLQELAAAQGVTITGTPREPEQDQPRDTPETTN